MTQSNGHESASAEEMPVSIGAAHDRVGGDGPLLHSGARLAAKLNARIIVNGAEFNNPGEMSVDDRQMYHEALAALFPPGIAVFSSEAQESVADRGRRQRLWERCLFLVARLLRLKR